MPLVPEVKIQIIFNITWSTSTAWIVMKLFDKKVEVNVRKYFKVAVNYNPQSAFWLVYI